MSYLSLQQFSQHSRLSAVQIVALLEAGALPCRVSPEHRIEIDTRKIDCAALYAKIASMQLSDKAELPEETGVLLGELEPLLEEAITLALSWLEKESA